MWELSSLKSWGHWVVSGHREGVQWEARVSEVMSSPGSPRDRRSMLPRIDTRLRLCGTCVLRGWSKWAMQLFPWQLEKGERISSDWRKEEVDIGGFQLPKVRCPVPFPSLDINPLLDGPSYQLLDSDSNSGTYGYACKREGDSSLSGTTPPWRPQVSPKGRADVDPVCVNASCRPTAHHQANYQHATTYTHIRLDQDP